MLSKHFNVQYAPQERQLLSHLARKAWQMDFFMAYFEMLSCLWCQYDFICNNTVVSPMHDDLIPMNDDQNRIKPTAHIQSSANANQVLIP